MMLASGADAAGASAADSVGTTPPPKVVFTAPTSKSTSTAASPEIYHKHHASGLKKAPKKAPKPKPKPKKRGTQAASELPPSVNLSGYDVPVGDQGTIVGSCTTWAIDYALIGWWQNKTGLSLELLNPMYTYSQIHLDNSASGGGSRAADAMKTALEQGNDTMNHYSHETTDFIDKPNAEETANAAKFKISGWRLLALSRAEIQAALAAGLPVAIGLPALDGDYTSKSRGNHEVLAVGYDQSGLIIQNSWGTAWGYRGYGRLSWPVVDHDVYQAHVVLGLAQQPQPNPQPQPQPNPQPNPQPSPLPPDRNPPAMTSLTYKYELGEQADATTQHVRFDWSASDNTGGSDQPTGVAAYEVSVSTDGGAFVLQPAVAANATSYIFLLNVGHSYQVSVRARDGAGNFSAPAQTGTITPSLADDTSFSLSNWERTPLTGTIGGTYSADATAGTGIRYTFTGTAIALVSPTFNTAGRATVSCDDVSVGTLDLFSATTQNGVVKAECHFPDGGQHSMQINVEGTSGRPWVGVDAFLILS
jgi:hypothetical protein